MGEKSSVCAAFEAEIAEKYGVLPDYPFTRYPGCAVFRHGDNQKCFALMMRIPKTKLGLDDTQNVDIVNLKCPAEVRDTLMQTSGIFPAYHMAKGHWISVLLDGSVDRETLSFLLAVSHSVTKKKK